MSEPNPFLLGTPKPISSTPPINLTWTALTQSGTKKTTNDDSHLIFASNLNGATPLPDTGSHSLADHDLILAISDGMGGGNAGDIASSLLLQELTKIIPQTFKTAAENLHPDYLTYLKEAISSIHHSINQNALQDPEKKGMAATLALTWFTPDNLYLTNVGDSRIYLHREEKTTQLTTDHTFAWNQMNRGEITERQFRSRPRRPYRLHPLPSWRPIPHMLRWTHRWTMG